MSKANLFVNIIVVIPCVATTYDVANHYLTVRSQKESMKRRLPQPGATMEIPGKQWGGGETVVLAISRGCKFCNASAPFYQTLLQSASPAGVAVVAITEDSDIEKTREHFAGLGVDIQEVRPVDFSKVGIHATPTLVIVDQYGKVVRSWVGEIKPGDQEEVISLISSAKGRARSSSRQYLKIPGGNNKDDSRALLLL